MKKYNNTYFELLREEAETFYYRYCRTIYIGEDPYNSCYRFNIIENSGKSIDDCVKQYLKYHDEPVRFFVNSDPCIDIDRYHLHT